MKKMMCLLFVLGLMFTAQANIVNGTFDIVQTNMPHPGPTLSGNPIGGLTGPLNDGWGTNAYGTTPSSAYMQISGGIASRNTGGPAILAGVVQFFTDAQVGALKLQYDLQIVDDNSSDSFYIQLYGYKYQSGTFSDSSIMTAGDGAVLKVNSTGAFGASTNWVVTALIDYKYSGGTLNGGEWLRNNLQNFIDTDVTAGEYDMYGIRITSTGGAGDTINVDNISMGWGYEDVYPLTVNFGTGGASYISGQQVHISANAPATGKAFDRWIGDTQYVNNVTYTNALVTMPAQAISLTATYKDVYYTLTVNSGSGSGPYTNQQRIAIAADTPASGKAFYRWTGDTQCVASITSPTTTVTMPAQAVALTATYKDIYCAVTVISAHGTPIPAVGTNVYLWGAMVTCSVDFVVAEGLTNWICSGWTGTGDVPASGSGHTTGAILLTNLNSSITWNWSVPPGADLWVENVTAAQRPGTKLVDISYDVRSTKTNVVTVSLTVSNGTQAVNAVTASGAVGPVATGAGKSIVWDAGADWNGNLAALTIHIAGQDAQGAGILTPSGRVRIPAGINSGTDPDTGAYSITVTNAFFMDASEATKAQWDAVYVWALTNGYTFSNSGSGIATNYPVHTVSWYDAVKWCNARSAMEGFIPCYNTNDWNCDFNANGYRLPTVAEWQYAARGGLSGKRFPWGDTIAHSNANYYSSASYSYDVSPTRGFHRVYGAGTAPEESGTINGYGLYAMAGNVMEWCYDASGANRALEGGSWNQYASEARCAYMSWDSPLIADDTIGFRTVQRASSSASAEVASGTPVDTRDYLLIVSSEHGTPVPSVGANVYAWSASVTCSVDAEVIEDLTSWTSAGWSGSGSVPASGVSENTGSILLTNLNSSIVWNWNTNYWLQVEAAGSGSVSTPGGWRVAGASIQISATAHTYYHFTGWYGDTEGDVNSSPMTLVMNGPRWVAANFAPNVTTNTGTPEWWLAQYGLTNFNADVLTDTDLDGVKTWEEYIAGTDPTNRSSVLTVAGTFLPSGSLIVSWFGVQGRTYTLQYADLLMSPTNNWQTYPLEFPGLGAVISTTGSQIASNGFYRVKVRIVE